MDKRGDDLEKALNKEGLTLGDNVELVNKYDFYLSFLWIHGLITDSELKRIEERLKKVIRKMITKVD